MTKKDLKEGGLTSRQIKALPHIVSARTYEEGCKAARISKNTFFRWLKEDHVFRAELYAQRDAVVEVAFDALKANITAAITTLVKLLKTKNEYLRRSVANDILGHVLKWKETVDLERRIASLESLLEKEGRNGR